MFQPLIFVVEHNKLVRSSILKRLSREGFLVRAFESGESFLETLAHEQPALVLLDYKMAGLNGERTLDEMRKMGLCLPVVLLAPPGDIGAAMDVSAQNYQGVVTIAMKSLELEDIVRVVQGAMTAR